MNSALLEEACDVFFGAGGPSERRAVIHQLSGHDERVPPFQLAVITLAVMMNSKAAFKYKQHDQLMILSLHKEMFYKNRWPSCSGCHGGG